MVLVSTSALKGISLRIVPASRTAHQTTIAANFPFDPKLEVEILSGTNRITTGPDASLTVSAVLSDASLCLSDDSTFKLSAGVGTFSGSICEVVDNTSITISFTADASSGVVTSDSSKPFKVTGDIHLALFQKDFKGKDGQYEDFMRNAIDDINQGYYNYPYRQVFPGRTIKLKSYYFPESTTASVVKAYSSMKAFHNANPEQKAHAVIGFANNEMSRMALPWFMVDKYSVTSYRQDTASEFSDKTKYPTFNRIIFDDDIMDYGLLLYLKERSWYRIIIIMEQATKVSKDFYFHAEQLGISVLREFVVSTVRDLENQPAGSYQDMLSSIKSSGTRLIVSMVTGDTSTYLHVEAMRLNCTAAEGFQWVGYKNLKYFPTSNKETGCHTSMDKLCNMRFKGMTFVEPVYLVDGWDTVEWLRVWNSHLRRDGEKSLTGSRIFPYMDIGNEGAIYGLTYDVISTNILAMERLINAKLTISGTSLAQEIRTKTTFHGLTGQLRLDANTGSRGDYKARADVLWPVEEYFQKEFRVELDLGSRKQWDWTFAEVTMTNTIFTLQDTSSKTVIESKCDGGEFRKVVHLHNGIDALTGYIQTDAKFKNLRIFTANKGIFNINKQRQAKTTFNEYDVPVYIPEETEIRTELVPAAFYCAAGCGGNQTNVANINLFDNGECVEQDICQCNQSNTGIALWTGPSCELAVCTAGCQRGTCVSPANCVCLSGWSGVDCSSAVCSSCSSGGDCVSPQTCVCNVNRFGPACAGTCTCVNGACNDGLTGDGKCDKCDSGYIGANCDISLIALCIPTITGTILLAVGLYFLAMFFINRAKLRAALFNNDWIVQWPDLKRHDEVTGRSSMFLSALSMNRNAREGRKQVNTGTWEGVDVHYQKLDKDSINLTDSIRLEVKQMRDMRHVNISALIGCCIEAPNVAILTELQPKGSLDDILTNEDIKLPWNFRFALLKGVCSGMEYIHKSEIRSHGRLKSTNCLVDNRWTVKLSGFGLHQFKAGQKGVGEFNPHSNTQNIDPSMSSYGALLWTPPEILHTGIYHIDHVGRGTVEGDIYSLGMIISEMCTRDFPFADVMLEKQDIVGLICGQKNEDVLKVWNDYIAKLNVEQGGDIRPCIKDKEWPNKYEKRKALKKLMESCWHEDPVHRPTLKECRSQLEHMEPQRGELMDHLVNMLEKYSSNLEDIVAKRTKQLQKEKQKTEDLVSRLLPKSVAEDLKQGKRVEAENFDHVTIYFSDIVGFTSIAKASTPLEVVALLNDMYTAFDSISANYDVYKVETIGDAYMIVSGLPTRNGDKHAGEICTTAMDLMNAIGDFTIAHMPDTKMKLRAGIHTGNVVAGVVGLKMPRYCLFGESVNVASKMESGGKPMRIHISEDTYTVLQRLGGYKCEYRQEVEVKGRGLIKTYWLTGKSGYDQPLPVPDDED